MYKKTNTILSIKKLKPYRQSLRNNATKAERFLWFFLKGNQFENRKFRRQQSIGYYIVDFYCASEKLCIELDGEAHYTEEGIKYDIERTKYVQEQGYQVIRFENKIVLEKIEYVLEEIK
ncbi:MAG: endonuclease domain-containing protein, partial [Sediminibacterium sp.]|nr:endonuclease domain-containing protein [Sediminibacterium sp.]